MSATIDDRIVSLEFDNKQFERGVDESIKTLEKLKESLKLDHATDSLSAISDVSKKIDLNSVSESVDRLSDKFSTLRMIGLMALSNIVDSVMDFGRKIGSALTAPFSQIAHGGWARAMNIEDAKFQLQGLKVSWNSIKDDIDYGVKDTAYGLDAAARAASQLVASGVQVGDSMKGALRGISGVAAMTNSSYEEISPIFTTIAGQGKVMTMQLRQLENRGLNAAATLADFFTGVGNGTIEVSDDVKASVASITKNMKVSESAVRDMVTHGEIDFKLFSTAMDNAFGEHAKEANQTFTGALSNVKAALSRIGAEFATPLIHNAIPVLNSIRGMINAIKDQMGDVFKLFSQITTGVGERLTGAFNKATSFIKNDFTGMENITRALYTAFISIVKVFSTIKEAFKSVFTSSLGDTVNKFAKGIERVALALQPTEKGLEGFKSILTLLFTVIKSVGEALGWVATKIGGPLLNGILRITDVVIILAGKLANIVTSFINAARSCTSFDDVIQLLARHGIDLTAHAEKLKAIFEGITGFASKAGQVISSALKMIGTALLAISAGVIAGIWTAFEKLASVDWSKFISAFTNVKNLIIEFVSKAKELPIVQRIIEGIGVAFTSLVGIIYKVGEAIKNGFLALANGEVSLATIKEKVLEIPTIFGNAFDKVLGFFKGNSVFGKIKSALGGISDYISGFVSGIRKTIEGLTPAKVLLVAFATAITTLAISSNKLVNALTGAVENVSDGIHKLVGYFTKEKSPLDKFKETVLTLTTAIVALTGAFYVLSKIDNLRETATTIGVFIASMAGISIIIGVLDKFLKLNGGFGQFVQNMALFSLGVASLSGALYILGKVPAKGIMKKVGVLTILIGELIVSTILLSEFGPQGISGAVGMLSFAVAVVAIAFALQKLDGVNLSGIKGLWPELTAILLGVAVLCKALGSVGTAVFAGAIAFLLAAKLLVSNLDKIMDLFSEASGKLRSPVEAFKRAIQNLFESWNEVCEKIAEEAEKLGLLKTFLLGVAAAGVIAAIIVIANRVRDGITTIVSNGKAFKNAAKGVVLISAAVAALIYFAKYVAQWINEVPNMKEAMAYVGIGVVAVGVLAAALMRFSNDANEDAIVAAKKLFTSLALLMLSMATFVAVAGSLDESEWDRAHKSLTASLVIIGLFSVIIAAIGNVKSDKASFGHFAGIVLLLGVMLGSLAALMIVIQDEKDYIKLGLSVIAIVSLVGILGMLMESIAKIKTNKSVGPILALAGVVVAIGGAIAIIAHNLPDEHYIGKIIASSVALIAVMAALAVIAGLILHYSKDTRFTVTQRSEKTLNMTFKGIGELVLGLLVVAASLALLKDANPGQMAAMALTLTSVMAALAGLVMAMEGFTKKFKLKGTDTKTLILLGELIGGFLVVAAALALLKDADPTQMLRTSQVVTLVLLELVGLTIALNKFAKEGAKSIGSLATIVGLGAVFSALAFVLAVISKMEVDAVKALTISQVIMLVLVELSGIVVGLGFLGTKGLAATAALPMLLGLTAVFTALAGILAIVEKMGSSASRMLAVSQVIMLVLAELSGITVGLGFLGVTGLAAVLALPALAGLTAVFAALGLVIVAAERISGPADRMLAVSQVITLVLTELSGICVLLGLLFPFAAASMLALPTLAGLTVVFATLGLVIVALKNVDAKDAQLKLQSITDVLWDMIKMVGVLGLLSAVSLGELAGATSVLILASSLVPLVASFKMLEPISYDSISKGMKFIADALKLLLLAGAGAAALSGGLTVLAGTIVALGVGCLAAGGGVKLFADGIDSLTNTTPGKLNNLNNTIVTFFRSLTVGIVTMIQGLGVSIATSISLIGQSIAGSISSIITGISTAVANGIVIISNGIVTGIRTLKTRVSGELRSFPSDLVKGLFDNSILSVAYNKFVQLGDQMCKGFRKGAKWHSPPLDLPAFFNDLNAALDSGGTKSASKADRVGELISTYFGKGFSDKFTSVINTASGFGQKISDAVVGNINFSGAYTSIAQLQNMLNGLGFGINLKTSQMSALNDKWKSGQLTLKEYTEEMGKVEKAFSDSTSTGNALGDTIDDLTGGLGDLGSAAGGAGSSMQSFGESLRSTLQSQMNIFEKFDNSSQMSKEELLANMKSQISGMANWASNMDKLATLGIDKGLYQKLAEMGPQGQQYVAAFASMTADELGQANELWAQSLVLPGAVANKIEGNMKNIGENTLIGYQNGLDAQTNQTLQQLGVIATDGVNTFAKGVGVASPSTKFHKIGVWMMVGLDNGIKSYIGTVYSTLTNFANTSVTRVGQGFSADRLSAIGISGIQGMYNGINSKAADVYNLSSAIGKRSMDEMANGVSANMGKVINAGAGAGNSLAQGISSASGTIYSAGVSAGNSAISGIWAAINDQAKHSIYQGAKQMGEYVGQGLVDGINSKQSAVEAAGRNLANMASNATKHALGEKSPSKVYRKIGQFASEGLALGIMDNADMVCDNVVAVAESTIVTMQDTIRSLAREVNAAFNDVDTTPVIKPILDLSNVESGMRTLSGVYNTNATFQVANGSTGNLQNGQLSSGNVVFNQYNTSPKALSRIDIYRDTRNILAQARGALS